MLLRYEYSANPLLHSPLPCDRACVLIAVGLAPQHPPAFSVDGIPNDVEVLGNYAEIIFSPLLPQAVSALRLNLPGRPVLIEGELRLRGQGPELL